MNSSCLFHSYILQCMITCLTVWCLHSQLHSGFSYSETVLSCRKAVSSIHSVLSCISTLLSAFDMSVWPHRHFTDNSVSVTQLYSLLKYFWYVFHLWIHNLIKHFMITVFSFFFVLSLDISSASVWVLFIFIASWFAQFLISSAEVSIIRCDLLHFDHSCLTIKVHAFFIIACPLSSVLQSVFILTNFCKYRSAEGIKVSASSISMSVTL